MNKTRKRCFFNIVVRIMVSLMVGVVSAGQSEDRDNLDSENKKNSNIGNDEHYQRRNLGSDNHDSSGEKNIQEKKASDKFNDNEILRRETIVTDGLRQSDFEYFEENKNSSFSDEIQDDNYWEKKELFWINSKGTYTFSQEELIGEKDLNYTGPVPKINNTNLNIQISRYIELTKQQEMDIAKDGFIQQSAFFIGNSYEKRRLVAVLTWGKFIILDIQRSTSESILTDSIIVGDILKKFDWQNKLIWWFKAYTHNTFETFKYFMVLMNTKPKEKQPGNGSKSSNDRYFESDNEKDDSDIKEYLVILKIIYTEQTKLKILIFTEIIEIPRTQYITKEDIKVP